MYLLSVSEKSYLTKLSAPNLKANLFFSTKDDRLMHYSIHVQHQRIWNVALVNEHGAVDFVANEKNALSFAQDVDRRVHGIFFQTKWDTESDMVKSYVIKIDSEKVYLIAVDSQLDVPLLYDNKKEGMNYAKLQ